MIRKITILLAVAAVLFVGISAMADGARETPLNKTPCDDCMTDCDVQLAACQATCAPGDNACLTACIPVFANCFRNCRTTVCDWTNCV